MATTAIGSLTGGSTSSIGGPLDVQWIVEQIITSKQQPITELETYQTFYGAKKTAFQELNTKVSALESAIYNMNSTGFANKDATSNQEDHLTATANSTATNGNYFLIVRQLAQAQSNTSATFASVDTEIGSGTLTITQGSEELEITDTSGMTLTQLKDAINSSDLNVTATIIQFAANDYRLQVTANDTGTENAFTVDATGDVATNLNMATAKIEAKEAKVNVNTTEEADAITRSSNVISDAIQGVTLNLKQQDVDTQITLTVSNDTTALKEKIQTFVEKFNDAVDYLNTQFTYDETSGAAGVLSGEAAARKVQQDLYTITSASVRGMDSSEPYQNLATIGLTFNRSGELEIDEDKLDEALSTNLDAVKRIFTNTGTSSTSEVSYIGKSTETVPGRYTVYYDAGSGQWSFRYDSGGATQIEAAQLEGNVITGTEGQTKGLMVMITPTMVSGEKGEIYLTAGVLDDLRANMYELSFPYSGVIAKNIEALDDQLENIANKISDINRQLQGEAERLITEFSRANEALVQLQYLQSSLSNNFAGTT